MAKIKPVPGQMKLPRELQLIPRTPHPMTIGDPGWIKFGKYVRDLVPRTPAMHTMESMESFDQARARGQRTRVEQGFPEQVELPWP